MANKSVVFQAPDGSMVTVLAIDTGLSDGRGNTIYRLGVDTELDVGPISIGAVTLKDNTTATQATVKTVTSVAETDSALAVQAPVLGKINDVADKAGGASSINAKIRGLINILADVWDDAANALGIEGKGVAGTGAGGVLTVQGDPLGTPVPVSLSEDIELGAVKLMDSAGVNEAQIAAVSAIAEAGSTKLAVHDPTVGITTGAAVITDAAGTLQQYLRGIVKLLAAGISVTLAAGTAAIGAVTNLGYASSVAHTLGIGGVRFTSADASAAPVAVTDAPGVGKSLVITDIVISLATALTVTLTEEATGNILFSLVLPTGSFMIPLRGKLKLVTPNKKLMVQTSLLGGISVSTMWYDE